MTAYLPSSTIAKHNGSIDILRFFAAIGVVWFHCSDRFNKFGIFGLYVFIILLTMYGVKSEKNARQTIENRFSRLLVPWAFASLIFGGAKLAEGVFTRSSPDVYLWMLLTGPSIHLWFLPFAFVLSLWLLWLRVLSNKSIVIAGLCLIVVGVFNLERKVDIIPITQWLSVSGSVGWGILLAKFEIRTCNRIDSVGLLIMLMICVNTFVEPFVCLAVALVLAAVNWRTESTHITMFLSSMAYGIYIFHPLIDSIVRRVPSLIWPVPCMLVIIGSCVVAWCLVSLSKMRRFKLLRVFT